jgi:hypothetical protein
MEENKLELRMYFFTIYQLPGMQGGIQSCHSALRYVRRFYETDPRVWDFVDNHETIIVLNGGTTNDNQDEEGISIGTLNQIADSLHENDIPFSFFNEPDLNYALTSVCFLLDERVFNDKKYPDFKQYQIDKIVAEKGHIDPQESISIKVAPIDFYSAEYKEWVRFVGGVKNVFLRDLIKGKKKL